MTITDVMVMPLVAGVSLALLHDEDGWRFESWWCQAGDQLAPAPPTFALQRRFRSPEQAQAFFRFLWRLR